MQRIVKISFGCAMVVALLIVACAPSTPASSPPRLTPTAAPEAATAAPAAFPMTVTDDAGRQVTLSREPQRLISLAPSNTEILFALGLGDRVVGVTTYCDYPEEARAKPKIGGLVNVNLELVVAASPDLIFATNLQAKKVVPELEGKGLTVIVIEPASMDDVLAAIVRVGRLTGRTREAEVLTGQMGARTREIEGKLATAKTSPRVFWETTRELITPAPGTFIGDMIARVGGANIVEDKSIKWPRLSQEVVVASDPEVIVIADHTEKVTPEEVASRPGWQGISAVKQGRLVTVNPDLVNRAGPRVVDGFEMVARAIHPEVFP